jgi:hypothetical protein
MPTSWLDAHPRRKPSVSWSAGCAQGARARPRSRGRRAATITVREILREGASGPDGLGTRRAAQRFGAHPRGAGPRVARPRCTVGCSALFGGARSEPARHSVSAISDLEQAGPRPRRRVVAWARA